jgi:hypothetical protein
MTQKPRKRIQKFDWDGSTLEAEKTGSIWEAEKFRVEQICRVLTFAYVY